MYTVNRQLKWAKAKIAIYNVLMKEYKEEGKSRIECTKGEIKEYRKASKIINAIEHPDTGKPILWPFRMSSFVPINMPIIAGMVLTKQTPLNLIFWQWLNQTYNAGWNYSNRNATAHVTDMELLRSYLISISSAILVSLTIRRVANRILPSNLTKGVGFLVNGFVSGGASSAAGFCNMLSMRSTEMQKGIKVKDKTRTELEGVSKIAAKTAVFQSAITRAILSWPVVFLPPLLFLFADLSRLRPRNSGANKVIDTVLLISALSFGLPFSLSFFPPTCTISAQKLETQFQGLKDRNGEDITELIFNKGL